MVFRDDMKATVLRVLESELADLTVEECAELADAIVAQIDADHEIIEDEEDFPGADEEEEEGEELYGQSEAEEY